MHVRTMHLLQWLESTFLGYLNEWEDSVNSRSGFKKARKRMMYLSKETSDGFKMTSKLYAYYFHNRIYLILYSQFFHWISTLPIQDPRD